MNPSTDTHQALPATPPQTPSEPPPTPSDTYDETAPPIWEVLSEYGETVADEVWAEVPTDLSKRIDNYLYGGRDTLE